MRGEVWTVCASGYAGKPRPAVIVQSDEVKGFESTVICLFTTSDSISGPTRAPVAATAENGLIKDCVIMAEKPMAVRLSSLGKKLGRVDSETLLKLDAALRASLGLS